MTAFAAPVSAQQTPESVVAGPLPDGTTLGAFDRNGQLCLRVHASRGGSNDCLESLPDTTRRGILQSFGDRPGPSGTAS